MKQGLVPHCCTPIYLPGMGAASPSFLGGHEAGRQTPGRREACRALGTPPSLTLEQILKSTGSSRQGWKNSCKENTCPACKHGQPSPS